MSDTQSSQEDPQGERVIPNETERVEVRQISRPWLGVTIACVVAALILVLLLIPGVLLYPQSDETTVTDDGLLAMQRESNKVLEDRVRELQRTLDLGMCVADGTFALPDENGDLRPLDPSLGGLLPVRPESIEIIPGNEPPQNTPEPGEQEADGSEADGPATDRSENGEQEPPPPEAAPETETQTTSLYELLDQSVFLVFTPNGSGTGFFIAPEIAVTNLHVVGEPPSDRVWAVNPHFPNGVASAEVLAHSETVDGWKSDFAILKVPGVSHLPALPLSLQPDPTESVLAAGFPGSIMTTDDRYQDLLEGNDSNVPPVAVTRGIVTTVQRPQGADVVLHTADVSSGNSGGPLVNDCGRVLGVNTFVRIGDEFTRRMNYALASSVLNEFLEQNGVAATVAEDTCGGQLAREVEVPSTTAPAAPVTPEASDEPVEEGGLDEGSSDLDASEEEE